MRIYNGWTFTKRLSLSIGILAWVYINIFVLIPMIAKVIAKDNGGLAIYLFAGYLAAISIFFLVNVLLYFIIFMVIPFITWWIKRVRPIKRYISWITGENDADRFIKEI